MTDIIRLVDSQQYDEEGRPRPALMGGDKWERPLKVVVRDGLLWPTRGHGEHRLWTKGAPSMLISFLTLAGADDGAYARYARRWGMLGLCGCDLPQQHYRDDSLGYSVCLFQPDGVPEESREWPERISAWRSYVDDAVRIVRDSNYPRPLHGPDGVTDRLNSWIDQGRVQLSFSRREGGRLHLGSGELFGGLAVAMLSLVMGGERLTLCAGCGSWFTPARRQVTGRLWCSDPVCQRAKRASASRDYRRRRREDPMRVLGVRGAWTVNAR